MHHFKPNDRALLRATIREASEDGDRECLHGAKGDVVIVRSVGEERFRYPIEVAYDELTEDTFFVAGTEIEPLMQ